MNDPIEAHYGHLPLSFEANLGQADPAVNFVARGAGYSLFLEPTQAVLALSANAPAASHSAGNEAVGDQRLSAASVRLRLNGANPHSQAEPGDPLPGRINYLFSNDPIHTLTDIPTYGSVAYPAVYPGIDLVYESSQGQLEYTFVVAPGSDSNTIGINVDGADSSTLEGDGSLAIHTPSGDLRQPAPVIYQDVDGTRRPVSGGYVLTDGSTVGFAMGAYDASRPLIIDPVLSYSSFLGGSGFDAGLTIAVDGSGDAYVAGQTGSPNFPTRPGAFQSGGSSGVFLSKLNPTGTALIYSTYLPVGSGSNGVAITTDAAGNVYISGSAVGGITGSAGAFQPSPGGGPFLHGDEPSDAFVLKLNPTGTALVYATNLGGSGDDIGFSIAVDAAGDASVAGQTTSPNFPTTAGAFQRALKGGASAFVSKLNPAGTALIYSTYLGGSGATAHAIAVDTAGNAYITGMANDLPITAGAFQSTPGGLFVTKLNPTGTALAYSTFLGSGGLGLGIAVDATRSAYVTGFVQSDFPTTPGAFSRTAHSGQNAFVTKLNATGTNLAYSTFLGSGIGHGIALDPAGNAYVAGETGDSTFPTTLGAFQRTLVNSLTGAFVSKLNATGTGLAYSTLLGNGRSSGQPGNSVAAGVAVDETGNAYVTGSTDTASIFPTTPGVLQSTPGGGDFDAFVARISPSPPVCEVAAVLPGPPTQLQVVVHADRGLNTLVVTSATNATVALPTFAPGATDIPLVTATKIDQTHSASVTLRATDQSGASTTCDPALVSVGRAPGASPVQVIHHIAQAESHLSVINGTPGIDRLRILVNGHELQMRDLAAGETRSLDVSSAMRKGTRNSLLVVSHGPRDGSATVIVSDSPD